MTTTVYGVLADELGLATKTILTQGSRRPELRRSVWATPAANVREVQAPRIIVDQDHDGVAVGEVVSLQRDKSRRLWAVAHIDDRVSPTVDVRVGDRTVSVETPMFWSASRLSTPDFEDIVIDSISLTAFPCRVGAKPLTFLAGALDHRAAPDRWRDQVGRHERELLTRAAHTHLDRRARGRHDPIRIWDETPPLVHSASRTTAAYDADRGPSGPLEFRTAEQVGVSKAMRTIELIVMPYNEEAAVVHEGRMVRESIAPGAFDGHETRAARVKVNRDHDTSKLVGRAVRLDPYAAEGLVADIKIANTELGNETLELASEGILDASAGFLPLPDCEVWESRSRRRITGAWLGHIALVAEPAYTGARVLAVRGHTASHGLTGASLTPNLDRLEVDLLAEKYALT